MTPFQIFEFDAAQIADEIENDFGIAVIIDKGRDGFVRIRKAVDATASTTVHALSLKGALAKFVKVAT